ncbi:E3 ubiquitin-protein ligase Hakai [Brevipalpus obovatus]|uniref:E3 ubiquitin-protein ligase Hakai n=1 Tax=Brevipalpus obovatus TaxID=246614 RepID=UPI003D9ED5E6
MESGEHKVDCASEPPEQEPEFPVTFSFASAVNNVPLHNNQPLPWKNRVNLIGVKCSNPIVHFCRNCEKPILIYGRLIPCKHPYCYKCARGFGHQCPKCNEKVIRVEKNKLGSVFVCDFKNCQRTYLSRRDLQAHIHHRHSRLNQPNSSNREVVS